LSSRHVALQKRAGQLKVRNPPATEACYALFIRAVDVVALRLAPDRCSPFPRRLSTFAPCACNLILPHKGRQGMAAGDVDLRAVRCQLPCGWRDSSAAYCERVSRKQQRAAAIEMPWDRRWKALVGWVTWVRRAHNAVQRMACPRLAASWHSICAKAAALSLTILLGRQQQSVCLYRQDG
jgi:hypothetical protein